MHELSLPERFQRVADLDDLYGVLKEAGMGPGWNKAEPSLYPMPKRTFVPSHWNYEEARAALSAAGDLVSTELAERRNLILANPVPGNTYATARTMVAAYQMVKGRETARSHRHTPNALRLVLETDPNTYTIVQGEKVPMEPGDVLLTPNWLWHGHSNESDLDAYWIDFLDAPLVQLLEPMFFEHFADGIEKPSALTFDSPMRFAWSESVRRLAEASLEGGAKSIQLGDPALDTIALYMHQIEPGTVTDRIQQTTNSIFAVVEGEGQSVIDGEVFDWGRGDVFVAPSWRPYTHTATSGQATLLQVTDEPVMQKLNWLRTAL